MEEETPSSTSAKGCLSLSVATEEILPSTPTPVSPSMPITLPPTVAIAPATPSVATARVPFQPIRDTKDN